MYYVTPLIGLRNFRIRDPALFVNHWQLIDSKLSYFMSILNTAWIFQFCPYNSASSVTLLYLIYR